MTPHCLIDSSLCYSPNQTLPLGKRLTDWVVPCKYLTSCSGDTHWCTHTHTHTSTQSRQKIRLTQPLKAVSLKSDYRWGSPQFPEHRIHHKHFGLENIYLFPSLSDIHTFTHALTHTHTLTWREKWSTEKVMAGGKLKVIKSSPPCLNQWDEGSQAHLTLHFPARLFLTPLYLSTSLQTWL